MDLFQLFRDPAPFMPHGMCLLWDPGLIWLHLGSDVLTGLAYYSIPVALFVFVRKRKDIAYRWMFVLFALFIAACGTTHILGAVTLWYPVYAYEGMIKAMTAAVSLATAVALWPLLPRAIALPSPSQLRRANAALQDEICERQRAESRVREANALLERRVAERTAELEHANATLERRVAERTAELEKAMHALRESETRHAVIFSHAADGIFLLDVRGDGGFQLADANPALSATLHLELKPLRGQPIEAFLPAEILAELRPRLVECVESREPVSFEITGQVGPRRLIMTPTLTPVMAEDGRVVQIVGTARDVTERKTLEAELAQAAKLATLGAMAAGVAHEMSQPLNAIRITATDCADLLAEGEAMPLSDSDRGYVREGMETIRDQSTRMGGIVDQLRLFGRKEPAAQRFDPAQPLHRAVGLLMRHFAGSDIQVRNELPPSLPKLAGQPSQLEQVAINLLSNARDAIEEGRRQTGPDTPWEVERDIIRVAAELNPARQTVTFIVEDHGLGLTAEVANHIFDPFFTTKEEQKGMGLGLSICSTIVNSMGGRIAAQPLPLGARFIVELPIAAEEPVEETHE